MPPETKLIPLPKGHGPDARAYLEAHGYLPEIPVIRSSDANLSEFQYYLSRILGLRPVYSYYEPFSIGGWAHTFLQLYYSDNRQQRYESKLSEHLATIDEVAKEIRMTAIQKQEARDHAINDSLLAQAIVDTAFHIPLGSPNRTIHKILLENNPSCRVVASELQLKVPFKKAYRGAQIDLLLYDEEYHTLRIVDLKTTTATPSVRAETCPVEYQTHHYMSVVNSCLPELIEAYKLSPKTRLRDMIHIVVQKPPSSMRMCGKDRDFTEYNHTLTRGPRKGQTEVRRTYEGEPKPENFRRRIKDYMLGEGEYTQHAVDRVDYPMADISYTAYERIDARTWLDYNRITDRIYQMATTEPHPENFTRDSKDMIDRGQLTPYALFYRLPVAAWPDLIKTKGLVVNRRDLDHMQEVTP